jgi:hypothetical protein
VNEIYCSERQGSHSHEWQVIPRFQVDSPEMIVFCSGCKLVGIICDPSPEEWQRAAEPYQWFEEHRIGLVGRSEVIDRGILE